MRRVLFAITALLLIAGRAQDAAAQCSISVLDINGTPNLCSDYGDDWAWTGPNGFTSSSMCIEATTPGTYTLRVYDFATNTWSEPCSHTVGDPPTAPGCAISGPDTVCAGQSVTWCAPVGDFTQVWSGPGGFSSTTSCITISEPGTYTLTVTDVATGMTSEPCSQTLRFGNCAPPPTPETKCPAPARWWASVIGGHDSGMDEAQQSAIAQAVDAHSAALDFGGTPDGLHDLLSSKRHGRSWHAARRHYAAVLANLVANDMVVTDGNGRTIGLSPSMVLDQVPGVDPGTTLAEWVASTEATLAATDEHEGRERGRREACRRIKAQAREINGGAHMTGCAGLGQSVLADDDDDEMDGFGNASLTTLGSGSGGGPFSGGQGVRFTLEQADDVSLDVVDVTGRHVKVLVRGAYTAGAHESAWDGRSDAGEKLRPGAYFVVGRIGGVRLAQRLILIR